MVKINGAVMGCGSATENTKRLEPDRIKQAQNIIWKDNEAACEKTNWARKQDRDECQIQDLDNGKVFFPPFLI